MGCDSHFFLEKRLNKGPWQIDPGHKLEHEDDTGSICREIPSLSGRDYYFFGIVAGVRYTVLKPVAAGRGLPNDLSPELQRAYREERMAYHSPTFLTVKELERVIKRYSKHRYRDPLNYNTVHYSPDAPIEDAFKYEPVGRARINNSVIKYIRFNLDWEKAENLLLGLKNKTEYRIIVWFDS